jgi:hypothetical protein
MMMLPAYSASVHGRVIGPGHEIKVLEIVDGEGTRYDPARVVPGLAEYIRRLRDWNCLMQLTTRSGAVSFLACADFSA